MREGDVEGRDESLYVIPLSVRVLCLAEEGTTGFGKVQTNFEHGLESFFPLSTIEGSPRCPP
jgi:hypothetical protein